MGLFFYPVLADFVVFLLFNSTGVTLTRWARPWLAFNAMSNTSVDRAAAAAALAAASAGVSAPAESGRRGEDVDSRTFTADSVSISSQYGTSLIVREARLRSVFVMSVPRKRS